MEIPKIVWQIANDNGYNSVEFVGETDGAEVYGMGIVGEDNIPEPIGLPELVLLRNGDIEIVGGEESMRLLKKLTSNNNEYT